MGVVFTGHTHYQTISKGHNMCQRANGRISLVFIENQKAFSSLLCLK